MGKEMNSEYFFNMSLSVKSSRYFSASSFMVSTSRVPDPVGKVGLGQAQGQFNALLYQPRAKPYG